MLKLRPRVAVLFLPFFAVMLAAPAALATDYYADVSGGAWTSSTTWHLLSNSGPSAPAGTYPGSAPGDRAIIDFQGIAVTVSTVIPNAVTLDANNVSCFVTVSTGGTLPLTGSSQIAGGTILSMSGGTVDNAGTLTIGSTSSIAWSSGTITGAGTTVISTGADLNATGSSIIVTGGQTINVFDTLTYGASAGGFAVNSGAQIVVQSGGLFDVQNASGISTDGVGGANITVNAGGTFLKSNGNFGTNIDPVFNNHGTVQVNISSLGFTRGTHTGSFIMNGPTTGIGFSYPGTHTFNGATGSISGTGSAFFGGAAVISAGADLDISNFSNDSFSSFSGNGTINLTGTFNWTASGFSGVTFNALAGSTVNITGAGNTSLQNAAHFNNQGTLTINPGATFSIVSDAHLTNDGTINIAGDLGISSDGAPLSRIDNLATRSINKTAGAGAATIAVRVNNAGSISSLAGSLALQQGGTHSGSWGLGTGADLVFDGGVHQFTGGTFSGSTGTVALNSGTMDVDAAITIPLGLTFQQSGGILTGASNLTINGSFLWTGGTMNNSSGGGQTVLTGSNSQIASTTSTVVLSGRTLSQTGTFTYNPTPGIELSIDDGGHFLNTGTFNVVGDAEIDSNQNATPRFTNGVGGAMNKTTGTGSADIYAVFRNLSSINLTGGNIALHGGGDDLGTVNFNSAANRIIIANGTFTLADQPGLNGAGFVSVDGPFATLGLAASVTIPKLEILNGSTVAGSTLNVSSSLLWRNGRMSGGVTNINVGATVDATSLTGTISLDTHSLTNSGTFNWDGTTHPLQLLNGSSLINNGSFNATGDGFIGGAAPANAITNNGSFRKTGGVSGTRIDPAFSNSGQLRSEVAGQSLIIAGGGSQTGGGSLNTVAGAFLDFFAGTYSVAAGTSPFMGSGIFRVNGGTLSITASMFVPSPAILRVDSGTLTVAAGATFQIPGGLQWNGGTLAGDGTTRTTNGLIGNTAPTTLNNNHTLTVAGGTFAYNGSVPNLLTIGGTANFNIEAGATVAMAPNSVIAGTSTDGLTVSGGGVLDTTAGLSTIGNGTLNGTIATGAAGRLDIGSGVFTMSAGAVTGSGTIGVTGGTLAVDASLTFPNLVLTAGTLTGSGALTVNGGSWSGGTMAGTGTTTLAGTFTFSMGSVKTLGRNLINNGAVTENDGFALTGAAEVTNAAAATWLSQGDAPMTCTACTGRFHNVGGYTRSGFFVTYTVPFDNDGQFTIGSGAQGVNLGGGGTHTGDFAVASISLLVFGGNHTFSSTSDIAGDGTVRFAGTALHEGTVVIGGTLALLGVTAGSTATFNTTAPVQAPHIDIFGTMAGNADVNVTGGSGTSTISGAATVAGAGTGTSFLNIAAGATLRIAAGGTQTLDGRTINNAGTFLINGALGVGTGGGNVINTGTLRGQATATFAPVVQNQATAEFLSGTVAFTGGYSQSAGNTLLNGGGFSSPLAINFTGGSLTGTGTITGDVSHAGTIAPGLSPGAITVTGNLGLAPASIVNIEIAGTTPATQYDQLNVGGAATLDGTLNVTFISGFSPADDDVFDVVTWGTRSGAFSAVNLPPYPAGTLTGTYEPNAFRIAADAVSDLAIAKTGPATAAVGSNVTFTITVTNNGPSIANGVIVSDPTPANLTFVSNSGDCTTAFPCSIGTIAPSTSKTITATYTVDGGAGSNVTNTASVSATTTDGVAGNNVASHAVFVELSDVGVTKTGPATAAFGSNVTFTITVTSNGPSPADGVVVSDPTPPNLTFVSNSGDCTTAFPCSLGTMAASTSKTINATYTVTGGAGSTITNTATVSSTSSDGAAGNDSASHSVFIELSDLAISKTGPATAQPGGEVTFTIHVANGGASAAANVVVSDPTPAGLTFLSNSGACTTPFPCSLGTLPPGATKTIQSTYSVSGTLAGSSVTNTATVSTNTSDDTSNNSASATVAVGCLNDQPRTLSPSGSAGANGTLSWRGRGDSYVVYFGPAGSGCSTRYAATSGTSVPYSNLTPGTTYEWRVESLVGGCATESSACVTFTVPTDCVVPAAPVVRVVGQTTSAKTYEVEWDAVPGATHYVIEEALNPEFTGTTRLTVTGTSQAFKHDADVEPIAYYYRVFAFADCIATPGPASPAVRVVIIPLPPKGQQNPSVNVPAGSEEIVVQELFIPGQPGQNLFYTATADRPWLTVRPEQGVLRPDGITLEVLADPKNLPNGTFTASVIVTVTDGDGIGTNGTFTVTTPISINLVTPITPAAQKPAASQYALIIPSAGHLGGIDSHWQSDIRVTNAGFKSARYKLTFTPSGGTAQGVKETTITVDAGATTALDDVIRNWYGLGTLGDGANGMLEILPLDDPAVTSQSTVASSRTYNVTGNGTLGQFIPAVPFPNFIGKPSSGSSAKPPTLSLQQIAQNSAYRTNVGLAEAAGQPVTALLSVFDVSGAKLTDIPVSLAAGEQRQLNQLLATHGIELADGRIEVQVTGGDGKITAYASVVDSKSQDPLLVSGELLGGTGATKFVLPGVANLDNQLASWRTDMRVFNYGTVSQPATLTFFPFNNGTPSTASVLLGAGQVMTLDNVLKSQFGIENAGGVVHLSTPNTAPLVVSGRTYNQTDAGTFGQFVPAVTVDQAAGVGGRTLHILQVEDSTRYRTNVGVAEVTGQPATVELQVVLPDSKITPTVSIPLAANEFRQFNVIRELGLGNVYNARITVRVIGGNGRVTAYGSVIDEITQDPTYVPAQ